MTKVRGAETEEVLAGWREVWTATHGRARVYHIATEDEMAACRPNPAIRIRFGTGRGIPLGNFMDAAEVPLHMRCRRDGCRQLWPEPTDAQRRQIWPVHPADRNNR